jgi:hypothetical protein
MDTLIFLLIVLTFVAMWRGKHRASGVLFVLALVAMLLIFRHHATDTLPISL